MKHLRVNILLLIAIVFIFSSCYRLLLGSMGVLDNSVSLEKVHNSQKEVIFIPMHHIGKKEFYMDVKTQVDSLRKEGFVFYYEGVKVNKQRDSLRNDTLRRKLRQIMGNDVFSMNTKGGYIDTVNHTIFHKKLKILSKEDLVNQPPYIKMGIDTSKDGWADVYLVEMIPEFEKKFGEITLTECDLNTPYDVKYSCPKKTNKEKREFVLTGYRNNVIADKILSDPNKKIAIIYGSKHYDGVLKILQQKDSTWKSY